jgi:hypothetical protein
MKFKNLILCFTLLNCLHTIKAQIIANHKTAFNITEATIYVDSVEEPVVQKAAYLLQQDVYQITGKKILITHKFDKPHQSLIIIGTYNKNELIKNLANKKIINTNSIKNKWEAYTIQTVNVSKTLMPCKTFLTITGSTARGTAYGVMELCKQLGVSPWYWWADAAIKKNENLFINTNYTITDSPQVKYRGIFINDEAPCLSSWSREKFGGFNHKFYDKVFELMLRLKANYIWPAMWGNAFYDDDSLNIKKAVEYGIIIGTSHHEPLMRAHDEWRRYGKGKWNFDSNKNNLQQFWTQGMLRATNEKIVTIGMRGDGDEPMSEETATALLEKIVADQRKIIEQTTGKPAHQTPQIWALYKEVQDYYDKGMRVPNDVTLLLCDDNWGNIRRLPKLHEKEREGGYGIYYHFDYVGGPRNYKWLNTNNISRVWEQMNLAWQYYAKKLWIVNVGDIKPMELHISFFLDYAWNPTKINHTNINNYTTAWCKQNLGNSYAEEIAAFLTQHQQYIARRKPELINEKTFSLENYNEWQNVVQQYELLYNKANGIYKQIALPYQNTYYQIVLHPIEAMSNLYKMYYYTALNHQAYKNNLSIANSYADSVKYFFEQDSLITIKYHQLNNGKWNHMMRQTHIGYTYWQQPSYNKIPTTYTVNNGINKLLTSNEKALKKANIPANAHKNSFAETNEYIAIDASHYTTSFAPKNSKWITIPNIGKTTDGITLHPSTTNIPILTNKTPLVSYDIYTYSQGECTVNTYFSPTLNFQQTKTGLQYAIAIDNETPQIISINTQDSVNRIWEQWVADNNIIKTTKHFINKPGKHTIKYYAVSNGVVLQNITVNFGGLLSSYLCPPKTKK